MFGVVAFILHVLSVVLDVVELDFIAYRLTQVVWLMSTAIIAWAGLNYFGTYPELVQTLNAGGDVIWHYGQESVKAYFTRGR